MSATARGGGFPGGIAARGEPGRSEEIVGDTLETYRRKRDFDATPEYGDFEGEEG